jgi:hypothetical protein
MGRRSRKRSGSAPGAPPPPPPPARPAEPAPGRANPVRSRRARLDEAPRPPWHPVPLSELCILAGLVCLGVAFAAGGSRRGTLLALGFVLVAVAALEVALREHLAGYRSHSALLALAGAMALVVPVALLTHMPRALAGALVVGLFAVGFAALRALFRRRSGFGFRA